VSQLAAECHGKCVELFRDMLPTARRIAALGDAVDPFSKPFLEQVLLAGKATSTRLLPSLWCADKMRLTRHLRL
jgi:putative tryptophan/tyrosine transport system substrate-binding protein